MDEIVYAKWDTTTFWYLGQVLSIKDNKYNIHFMDGYSKDLLVPEKKLRKVPSREKKDTYIGKTFYDPGDKKSSRRKTTDFDDGEFVVLCRQPGKTPSYWCERITNIRVNSERDIQLFDLQWVRGLVDKYDKE